MAADLEVEVTKWPRTKPDMSTVRFGHEFSDHMFEVDWTEMGGWTRPKIMPIQDFSIHPAAKVFHYATELFEGLKAYRCVDGRVCLFRPDLNVKRMRRTAHRTSLPDFDEDELVECLKRLVSIDRDWVPDCTSSSLYIRPTMIGTEPTLGVSKPNSAKLYVITGPVGPYFTTGFKPVSLLADPKYVRAFEGGVGGYKMGANYAPTLAVQMEAVQKYNCQQVLWLYGKDQLLTEVGSMNFFMLWINEQGEKELLTPSLEGGTILPGVTRHSLLDMARQWNEFKVVEKDVTMKQVMDALKEQRVLEMFGSGTACTVCPIERIVYQGQDLLIPTMKEGAPVTNQFLSDLSDIQYGRTQSPWTVEVD